MDKSTKLFRIAAACIAGAGILAIIIVCLVKYIPSFKHLTPEEYFGTVAEDELVVIVEDHIEPERARIFDGNIYLDYSMVQRDLNSRFYWDSSEGTMIYTTAEQVYDIKPNSSAYTIDGESFDSGYEILKTTSAGMFLSMNFVQQYSNLHFEQFEGPHRVMVTRGSETVTTAVLKKNTAVRKLGGIKSPIITDAEGGTQVVVLDQMSTWSQIVTPDGYTGYVKNKSLKSIQETEREVFYQGPEYTSISMEERVNLVWHEIDYPEMNADLCEDISAMKGVNVISPTWYFLQDNNGAIESFADAEYVKDAHAAGLQVWALISNFSPDVSTTTLLATRSARQRVQQYLVSQAKELQFDGINIDFEGIAQEAGPDYVQFMRELSILCRKEGLVLSVDVPVPMDFSVHYNRGELGVVCDYVIMMGYDEHYAGCETAGSVASMAFEQNGIERMLTEVSEEKMISAIPFYTRVWYTETLEDGTTNVTSEYRSMGGALETMENAGAETWFDESTGQRYGEWTDAEGRFCQVWLEDEQSITARASMISTYNLAGIAEWELGNEQDYVWDIIADNIE